MIYGHSHKPSAEVRKGVLFLNPGSAGPRRFSLPICVARLRVSDQGLDRPGVRDLEIAARALAGGGTIEGCLLTCD